MGVEAFFVLSGFIISHNYADRFRNVSLQNYRGFLVDRFARLYPAHLITLVVVALLVVAAGVLHVALASDGKYDPLGFVMNLLMLQAVPPADAWNGPAWSISAELGAYLTFPLLALAVMRVRSRASLLALAAAALAFTVAGQFALAANSDFAPIGYGSIWIRVLGEFTGGCFLWRFWARVVKGPKYDFYAIAGVIVVCIATHKARPRSPRPAGTSTARPPT